MSANAVGTRDTLPIVTGSSINSMLYKLVVDIVLKKGTSFGFMHVVKNVRNGLICVKNVMEKCLIITM